MILKVTLTDGSVIRRTGSMNQLIKFWRSIRGIIISGKIMTADGFPMKHKG